MKNRHTCHLYFKCQFLSSNFTDVLSSIFLLYAVDHQLTNLALWIHVNYSAGFQLFAVFVPFHLRLVINNLTAQGSFLGQSSFHFPLDRLFVEERGFSLDFCTRSCKGVWRMYNYLYKRGLNTTDNSLYLLNHALQMQFNKLKLCCGISNRQSCNIRCRSQRVEVNLTAASFYRWAQCIHQIQVFRKETSRNWQTTVTRHQSDLSK